MLFLTKLGEFREDRDKLRQGNREWDHKFREKKKIVVKEKENKL